MPLPALWTESSLIAMMEAELESVTVALGLADLDVLATAATDVAAVLGVSDVADVTYAATADVVKVRVIAQWIAWQKAYDVATTKFDLKAGSAQLWQSQVFDHVEKRLARAEAAASVYAEVVAVLTGASGTAYVSEMATAVSPYTITEWD